MYKLLLCWRYLRTRYIALASIISVTLGVATMIVVNSVMAGFTHEMQDRIKGILSDVSFESRSLAGMRNPQLHMQQIRRVAGEYIASMTATVAVPAMLSYQVNGEWMSRQVQLIGIDPETKSSASRFGEYLQHPDNRREFSFALREKGYDVRDHLGGDDARFRLGMDQAGWVWRRKWAQRQKAWDARLKELEEQERRRAAAEGGAPAAGPPENPFPEDPFEAGPAADENVFDPETEQFPGCVLGIAIVSHPRKVQAPDGSTTYEDRFSVLPGSDVQLTLPTAGTPPKGVSANFTVVDFYESKMSEYDSSFVFVPIDKLQQLRGMVDPESGEQFVTSIQIKLKNEADGPKVRELLAASFPPEFYAVQTWQDKQGALLAAVQMETAILNILLFFIIAVAGFGILAIFFMIVVEKTKDIGILKSLGAHSSGIMGIFLSYGLGLGVVGSGAGMAIGLLFVANINWIREQLAAVTGHEVFDPSIYYFYEIPTIVDPWTVGSIVAGALFIAVMASVLPALRAARFHPVEALRYE